MGLVPNQVSTRARDKKCRQIGWVFVPCLFKLLTSRHKQHLSIAILLFVNNAVAQKKEMLPKIQRVPAARPFSCKWGPVGPVSTNNKKRIKDVTYNIRYDPSDTPY